MFADYASTHIYIIEFQKKDLLYAYILIILISENRFKFVIEINAIVNVEISNQTSFSKLYSIVIICMLYNNCNRYIIIKIDAVSSY